MCVHVPTLFARGCSIILALCFFQGCDEVRATFTLEPEALEQQLREEPGRPGKVGQILALGVRQRALRMSEDVAFQANAACVTYLPGAQTPSLYTYELELILDAPGTGRPPLSWSEEVSIARDKAGSVRIRQKMQYSQETGHQGAREHEWLSVGDNIYTSSGDARFVTHVEPSERARLAWVARRANTLQVLLSAVGGWEQTESKDRSARWSAGAEVLRCGDPVSQDELRWWNRWRSRGSVREASLYVEREQKRTLTASWDLGQEARLEARFTDNLERSFPEVLEAPPASAIVERTESWAEVDRALEVLEEDAVILIKSSGGEPVTDGAKDE
jgi:hypothetical protein